MFFPGCTLPDGGYYNTWGFLPKQILRYLYAMQASGVDVVDLEFRTMNRVVQRFQKANASLPLIAITQSRCDVIKQSVYGVDV